MTSIASAFVPVRDPETAAAWYADALGLTVEQASPFSAVLTDGTRRVTLMGPASGIAATPGLPWASCSYLVDDLDATRARLADRGMTVSAVDGAPDVCLFVTSSDPDGNVLLLVDR